MTLVAAEKYDDANQLVDLNPQIRPDMWNSNLQGIHKQNQASPLKMQEYWVMGETVIAATPPIELPTRPGIPPGPKKVLQVTAKSKDGKWSVYGIVTSSPEYWQ